MHLIDNVPCDELTDSFTTDTKIMLQKVQKNIAEVSRKLNFK